MLPYCCNIFNVFVFANMAVAIIHCQRCGCCWRIYAGCVGCNSDRMV